MILALNCAVIVPEVIIKKKFHLCRKNEFRKFDSNSPT